MRIVTSKVRGTKRLAKVPVLYRMAKQRLKWLEYYQTHGGRGHRLHQQGAATAFSDSFGILIDHVKQYRLTPKDSNPHNCHQHRIAAALAVKMGWNQLWRVTDAES